MSLFRQAVTYSGVNVLGQVALLVQAFAIRRVLAPEVLGIWTLALVVRQIALSFDPGVSAGAGRNLPLALGRNVGPELARLRSTALWGIAVQGLLTAGGIVIYAWVRSDDLSNTELVALHVTAAVGWIGLMAAAYAMLFQTAERFIPLSRILLIGSFLDASLLPLGAYLFALPGLMGGALAAIALRLLLFTVSGREMVSVRMLRAGIDRAQMRALLAFGLPFRIVDYPLSILLIADTLVVARFFSVGQLAIYVMAKSFVTQIGEVGTRIGTVVATRLLIMTGEGESREVVGQYLRSFILFQLMVLVPLMVVTAHIVIGLLLRELVPGWASGVPVLQVLLLTAFFVPQVAAIRLPLLLDKDLLQLGTSNLVGIGATALFFGGGFLLIEDVSLRTVSWMMLGGYAVYFSYVMVIIGRRLWGLRATAGVLGSVAVAAAWTGGAMELLADPADGYSSAWADVKWSAGAAVRLLAAVAPLAMVGLWQAGVVRLLRERNAARRHAAGAAGPTASEDHDAVGPNDPAGAE